MSAPGFVFYPGDYLRDTAGLRTEEHGAYLLLLLHTYAQGGRIRNCPRYLARVSGLTPAKFRKAWAELARFFYVAECGRIGHKRVDKELAKQARISAARSAAGSKPKRPRGGKKPIKNAQNSNEIRIETSPDAREKTEEKQAQPETIVQQKLSTKPIGLVSSPIGEEKPNLNSDGEAALARLLDAAASAPSGAREAAKLRDAVTGFHDGTFIIGGQAALNRFSDSLGRPLAECGLRLAIRPHRKAA